MGTTRPGATGLVLSVVLAIASAGAEAARRADPGDGHGYYVYADVVEVSPRYGWYEVTEPVRQCVDVDHSRERASRHASPWERSPRNASSWERSPDREYSTHNYQPHPHTYRRNQRQHHAGEGAAGLVGGLIGGVIGHQFGGGNGKTALTIAGAALGASIARDHARRRAHDDYPVRSLDHYRGRFEPHGHARTVGRCTESAQPRRVRGINGYDVTYRYQGATFHKWVDEHPGEVIRVRVDVEPVVDHGPTRANVQETFIGRTR